MPLSSRFNNLNTLVFGSQNSIEEDAYTKASEAGLFLKKDSTESTVDLVVSDTADLPSLSSHPNGLKVSTRETIPEYVQYTLSNPGAIDFLVPRLRHGIKMFFIGHTTHSHSRLQITKEIFDRLLEKSNIFPVIKDSILRMGRRDRELEIAPPCARSMIKFEKIHSYTVANGFELVYGFRFIERNSRKLDRSKGKPWSLRQFFTYNMTRYVTRQDQRWVFFGLPEVIRKQVDTYLAKSSQEIIQHPFDIHVLLASTAIRMWRPYFVFLTDLVEEHRRMIAGTDISNKDAVQKAGKNMMSELKLVENDILDAFLAVRATKDTLIKIQSVFKSVSPQEGIAGEDQDCQNLIAQAISDQLREVDMLMEQATSLQQKTTGLSATVADFLNLANAYWQEGNAKAVKGLSVIATIFLPITVVFGFFSTSFMDKVNYSGQPLGRWWLLLACGLPLSFATLVAWYMWVHRDAARKQLFEKADLEDSADTSNATYTTDRRLEDIAIRSEMNKHATEESRRIGVKNCTDSHEVVPDGKRLVSDLTGLRDSGHDSGTFEADSQCDEKTVQ